MNARLWIIAVGLLTGTAQADQYETVVTAMVSEITRPITERGGSAVAVLDFTDLQGRSTEFGRFLAEEVSTSLVIQQSSVRVIDRANVDRILAEHKLQRSGLADPASIKRLASLIGAEALVIGTYTRLGNEVRVSAKVIATDTAQVVAASRGNLQLTPDLRTLLGAQLFVTDQQTPLADSVVAVAPEVTARTEQQGDGYAASLIGTIYDPQTHSLTVQVRYTNTDDVEHCLGRSGSMASTATVSSGAVLSVRATPGLPLVTQTDRRYEFKWCNGNDCQRGVDYFTSKRDFTVVPPGVSQRIIHVFEADNLRAGDTLDISINLLRGHDLSEVRKGRGYQYNQHSLPNDVPSGCNKDRHMVPSTVIVFNDVQPRI